MEKLLIIAGYALEFGQQMEVIISSFDSDFFQLITDNVSILRYRGEKTVICTPGYIMEKFGIRPGQYADFKSLVGDTPDNIKGAEKVGVKTAALLLNEFGNLENIIANADNIRKQSIKESIIKNAEKLRLNKVIIRLGDYRRLPFAKQELEYIYGGITTNEVLKGIGIISI